MNIDFFEEASGNIQVQVMSFVSPNKRDNPDMIFRETCTVIPTTKNQDSLELELGATVIILTERILSNIRRYKNLSTQ